MFRIKKHIFICKSKNTKPHLFQFLFSHCVSFLLLKLRMVTAINFNNEPILL